MELQKKYNVGLGVTSQCNMTCSFCYSKDVRDNLDLPIVEWKRFFYKTNTHIKSINYGTGENVLLDDWFDLVGYINDEFPEIQQALTTNGTLFPRIKNNRIKAEIIKRAISEIDISIDYGDKEVHNHFRGNTNAYQNAISTLDFCYKNNIQSTVVIMGIDDNLKLENIEKIFNIARKYKSYVRINLFRPVNSQCNLTPPTFQKIVEVLDYLYENELIVSLCDPLFSAVFTEREVNSDPSYRSSIRILPNGYIFPSTYLISNSYKLGHINDPNVLQNIEGNTIVRKIIHSKLPDECSGCPISQRCNGGAIDRRYLWYNDLNHKDPYCPARQNKSVRLRSYKIKKEGFRSIHEGYLPTLFFKTKARSPTR